MQLRRECVHQRDVIRLGLWRRYNRERCDNFSQVRAQPDLYGYADDAAGFFELDGLDDGCVRPENVQLTLSAARILFVRQ